MTAAFLSSVKFNEDRFDGIEMYSKLSGICAEDLINLEFSFVILMDFNLFINDSLYSKYYHHLLTSIQ